jgi:hypothetical protein
LNEAIWLDLQIAMAYPNRALTDALVGKDHEAEQYVGRELEPRCLHDLLDGALK